MQEVVSGVFKRFLILWFPFCMIAPAFGQEGEPASKELAPPPESSSPPPAPAPSAGPVNPVQNAVLEGIQVSSEPSKEANENVITCYFIFRDKPSSYFYEVKRKTNKLVFEFNDTQKGSSPVSSQKLSPIEGFELEQSKIDVNKDVKGLNPEWHDMVSVTFSLSAIPKISVADEYNVISFNFKWSSDPSKVKALVDQQGKSNPGVIVGVGSGIVVAGGIAAYFILKSMKHGGGETIGPLDTTDLPSHSSQMWW